LLRAEGPKAALERLKQEVRRAPRDARLRTFLFQMFCLFGEWDRALTQLTVAAELDALALPMAQTYRAAIRCEILRERVFAGARMPTVLGNPGAWISLLIEANRVLAGGAAVQAAELRDAAFEAAPTTPGTIKWEAGEPKSFDWIADADPRLGPVIEAIFDGKYYWVPFDRIQRIDVEAPADLRDQIWMPVHFTWSTGGETVGFIPTRYPGSAQASEDLAASRRTEWREEPGDWHLGLGQRMLTTDADEVPLMDLRRLTITPADPIAAHGGETQGAPEPTAQPDP
jgi:type VI secretion system protein ImpE